MTQDNISVEPTPDDLAYAAARSLLMADAREMITHLGDWRKEWALGSTDRNRVSLGAVVRVMRGLYALAHQTPPATQPTATVGEDRFTPALHEGGRFREWSTMDLAAQCLSQAREQLDAEFSQFMTAVAERLSHTPPPVATATVVDAGEVTKMKSAAEVKVVVRAWLDADDAMHWGAFETALDAAINDTSERALVVAMLRADAETMRANAVAYSEEAPTDARALHEVAATLGFKAAQIERGDHLAATPTPPAGDR